MFICSKALTRVSRPTKTIVSSTIRKRFQSSSPVSIKSITATTSTANPQRESFSTAVANHHHEDDNDNFNITNHGDYPSFLGTNNSTAFPMNIECQHRETLPYAEELNLALASSTTRDDYDKILLLVQHGSDDVSPKKKGKHASSPRSFMTGRSVGQMLNLSRQVATYCNRETNFIPQLMVVSPMKSAIQTAQIVFPHYTPSTSLKQETTWICYDTLLPVHDDDMTSSTTTNKSFSSRITSAAELEQFFPGVQYCTNLQRNGGNNIEQWFKDNNPYASMNISFNDDNDKTAFHGGPSSSREFMEWIRRRDERVIAISGHSAWFQDLFRKDLHLGSAATDEPFIQNGEMRVLGIRF